MFIFLPECCYYLIVSDTDIGFLIIAVGIFAELIGRFCTFQAQFSMRHSYPTDEIQGKLSE